jgi:hypothetical protein
MGGSAPRLNFPTLIGVKLNLKATGDFRHSPLRCRSCDSGTWKDKSFFRKKRITE